MFDEIQWQYVIKPITDLKPFPNNPRRATKEQKERLIISLKRFGMAEPVIINTDGTVIGGNFRLTIYKEHKIKQVPCFVPHRALTDEEMQELNLRLNKNTAEWDYDILSAFNEKLLYEVGFDEVKDIVDNDNEKDIKLKFGWEVVIECESEVEQKQIYEECLEKGYKCRILTL